ncbi:MAG: dihydroorotate dehydrogenase [Coriobacteriia bacterium]|nr:dihydroorotate dehydrogenase [Coriobacteriia bacterium]MBN2841011.1 dihydroorotate dehydrogenase [Coriobacteriia bacterium]
MSSVDMRVRIGALELRNPVMTASGTFGSGKEYADFFDLARLGAVVTKGVSLEPWPGNPGQRIVETPSGMLNSIGLQNPGVEAFCDNDLTWLARHDVPVIVNVVGHRADEYAAVAERLEQESGVHALEVNISCPNVDAGGMAFGTTCPAAAEVVRSVRAVSTKTLIVKLSPNVTDVTEVARAVEAEGADAVSLINTLLGMVIDTRTFAPVLARGVGGLSGPAVRPVAVRMVWQVSQAVSVPVIGMGGITSAEDAAEFLLAGASGVAVGTANFMDPTTTVGVVDGLERFCQERGIEKVTDLVGAAWKR